MIVKLNQRSGIERLLDKEFNLYNPKELSFTEDVLYMEDDGDPEYEDIIKDLKTFGAVNRGIAWFIPAGLTFEIKEPTYSQVYFVISRKGIDLEFYDLLDLRVETELSNFGKQCDKAAKMLNYDIEDVRKDIIAYSKCFNIKIDE